VAEKAMKKLVWGLGFAGVLSLASCGGGGGGNNGNSGNAGSDSSVPPAPAAATPLTQPAPAAIAYGEDINPNNALLAASIADRAIARYLDLRELTGAVGSYAMAYAAPVPARVSCNGTDGGTLGVTTLAADAYLLAPHACRSALGIVFDGGDVGVSAYTQDAVRAHIAFDMAPRAMQVIGDGTDTVSGKISYRLDAQDAAAGAPTGHVYRHMGEFDVERAGKTDRYRNLLAYFNEAADSSAGFSLTLQSLDISSPRFAAATLQVRTLEPVRVDVGNASITGSVQVVSPRDGSRVLYEYVDSVSFRVRNWDGQDRLLLDVIKTENDADLAAAEDAAIN
jgi:hypothetical protein